MLRRCSLATICASVFLGGSTFAQIPYDYRDVCFPVYRFNGSPLDRDFGRRIENLGDVDHDGVNDLVISIPGASAGHRYSGAIRVFSLSTGDELYTVRGEARHERLRALGYGGDVNADGTPDWIATDSLYGVHVHSGVDGARLLSWSFSTEATSASIVGDVNGDGFADILIGTPYEDSSPTALGRAHLLSGRDGALIRQHNGVGRYRLGYGVVGIGDRDGDGVADYAIGGSRYSPHRKGAVYVHSGATGQVVFTLASSSEWPVKYGWSLHSADDLDGDGVRDLIVFDRKAVFGCPGKLYAYSLTTGALLYSVDGSIDDQMYEACANVGDADGDGVGDLAVFKHRSMPDGLFETVDVLSGADGSLIRRFIGAYNYHGYGDVTGVGDVTGDGVPEFVTAASDRRASLVISTRTLTSEQICGGEVNSRGLRGELGLLGPRSVSLNDLSVNVWKTPGNVLCQVFYGNRRVRRPFGSGVFCIGGRLHRLGVPFQSSSTGGGWFELDLTDPAFTSPPGALVAGSTWGFQAWYRDAPDYGGFNFTNALSLTFCP
ncbi:MAG: hypothetical protein ACI8QZ_003344 [Chlamydiales bacterium]|jgi:hypothetical protein